MICSGSDIHSLQLRGSNPPFPLPPVDDNFVNETVSSTATFSAGAQVYAQVYVNAAPTSPQVEMYVQRLA